MNQHGKCVFKCDVAELTPKHILCIHDVMLQSSSLSSLYNNFIIYMYIISQCVYVSIYINILYIHTCIMCITFFLQPRHEPVLFQRTSTNFIFPSPFFLGVMLFSFLFWTFQAFIRLLELQRLVKFLSSYTR